MIDKDLLNILACPETKKDLEEAGPDVIDKVNAAIREGRVRNKAQEKVTHPIEGGLFRAGDRSCLYPVRENIPVLLVEELILLDGIV